MSATRQEDVQAIQQVIEHYIAGVTKGDGNLMKPAFDHQATIDGFVGDDRFQGPIKKLFDWNTENGPAQSLRYEIMTMDIVESICSVKLELWDWTGYRFTDMFNLLKVDNQWKIVNKIFHLHNC